MIDMTQLPRSTYRPRRRMTRGEKARLWLRDHRKVNDALCSLVVALLMMAFAYLMWVVQE